MSSNPYTWITGGDNKRQTTAAYGCLGTDLAYGLQAVRPLCV